MIMMNTFRLNDCVKCWDFTAILTVVISESFELTGIKWDKLRCKFNREFIISILVTKSYALSHLQMMTLEHIPEEDATAMRTAAFIFGHAQSYHSCSRDVIKLLYTCRPFQILRCFLLMVEKSWKKLVQSQSIVFGWKWLNCHAYEVRPSFDSPTLKLCSYFCIDYAYLHQIISVCTVCVPVWPRTQLTQFCAHYFHPVTAMSLSRTAFSHLRRIN